ncbi:MAG: tetratricopeptide repeat protein [Leptolyngbya sp. PLA1]|nr:tetratricopeptide repeat protein [Leptolyngbya sp. PLA1]
MDINQRIAQFETMVRPGADPTNDMAWFSLGQAYAQAGRHADAAGAFERCYTLNPAMSKAFQLAGRALIDSGDSSRAKVILKEGFLSASGRGDRLPAKAMGEMLLALGEPIPETPGSVASPVESKGDGSFVCTRTGRPGSKLPKPPFKGPLGQWIYEHISAETWDQWIRQGTKVINELRLDLSRDEDAATYDRHMREYLGVDDELLAKLSG